MGKIYFSIIMPAYNCEKTIKKAVNSILNQNFSDFELIIIDDGSTDKTNDILMSIKDNRIKVLKQKNSGASFARNTGINNSSGQYIIFCDSDDELESNILNKLYVLLCKKKYDVVLFKARRILNNKVINDDIKIDSFQFNSEEKIKLINSIYNKFLSYNCILGFDAPWGKAVSKEILINHNIFFPNNVIRFEDSTFCSKLYQNCNNIYFYNVYGYKYIYTENSICNRYNDNAVKIFIDGLNSLYKYRLNDSDFYIKTITTLTECEKMYFLNNLNKKSFFSKKKEFKAMLNNNFYQSAIKMIKYKNIPFHYKIEVLFLRLHLYSLYFLLKKNTFK